MAQPHKDCSAGSSKEQPHREKAHLWHQLTEDIACAGLPGGAGGVVQIDIESVMLWQLSFRYGLLIGSSILYSRHHRFVGRPLSRRGIVRLVVVDGRCDAAKAGLCEGRRLEVVHVYIINPIRAAGGLGFLRVVCGVGLWCWFVVWGVVHACSLSLAAGSLSKFQNAIRPCMGKDNTPASQGDRRGLDAAVMNGASPEAASPMSASPQGSRGATAVALTKMQTKVDLSKARATRFVRGALGLENLKALAIRRAKRQFDKEQSAAQRHVLWLMVHIALYILGGALFFSLVERWDFSSGVYFATVTMATVGYGDYVPKSAGAKFAAILYGLIGPLWIGTQISFILSEARELAIRRFFTSPKEADESNLRIWGKILCYFIVFSLAQAVFAYIYLALGWNGPAQSMPVAGCPDSGTNASSASAEYVYMPELTFSMCYWHAWQTSTTIGYGDMTPFFKNTPQGRLYSTVHILLSAFTLAYILSDVQKKIGTNVAHRRKRMLLSAKVDNELIFSLDRDGNGVDRVEYATSTLLPVFIPITARRACSRGGLLAACVRYTIGMLIHLNLLQWSDVQPFLDQFDRMDTDGSGYLDRADLERYAETNARITQDDAIQEFKTSKLAKKAGGALMHKLMKGRSRFGGGEYGGACAGSKMSHPDAALAPSNMAASSPHTDDANSAHQAATPQNGACRASGASKISSSKASWV